MTEAVVSGVIDVAARGSPRTNPPRVPDAVEQIDLALTGGMRIPDWDINRRRCGDRLSTTPAYDTMSYVSEQQVSDIPGHDRSRSATLIVVGMLVLAIAAIVYIAFATPGMDHSATMSNNDMPSHGSHRLLDPERFAAAMAEPGALVINVHVPADEVLLNGTDLTIRFDDIDPALLPADRSTPLAVYCRSGTMSATAVTNLIELGFTDIVELDGGTQAWTDSGRPLADIAES